MHNLGVRFDTPTINLYFETAKDFVKFCSNLKYYLSEELVEKKSELSYPVGTLGSDEEKITLCFMHYENFSQAKTKWDERKKRVDFDNLYFIMSNGEKHDRKSLLDFDSLPYKHKAILSHKKLDDIKSVVILPTENKTWLSRFAYKTNLDRWDYVSFLNKK